MFINKIVGTVCVLSLLQGCAAVVVAGAGGVATAANDHRSLGAQIDDNTIELKVGAALRAAEGISKNTHIVYKSVNAQLLLVGQSPNQFLRDLAIKTVSAVAGVKQVHNQIRVGTVTSITTQTFDTWLTTKVKLQLLTEDSIKSSNIKVLTENTEVYLMGLVSAAQADKAVEVTRNISGVSKVIKVFEILPH